MFSTVRNVAVKHGARAFSTSRAAADMSRVTLIGRLGQDPVLRQTSTGKPYYTYSVATSVGAVEKDEAGNIIPPPTSWHTIFAFSEAAQNQLARVGKGSAVYVEAEFEMRSGGSAPDGTPLPDRPLLRHQKLQVISRVKPQSETESEGQE